MGAGGHARVLIDLLTELNSSIKGFVDDNTNSSLFYLERLGNIDSLLDMNTKENNLALGIGFLGKDNLRNDLYSKLSNHGFEFPTLIHPSAFVSQSAKINMGSQILMGSLVQAGSTIGTNTVINSKCSIDHDCTIGNNCHIAPGSTLCGGVSVEDNSFIGAGSIIVPGKTIAKESFIKAGSILT